MKIDSSSFVIECDKNIDYIQEVISILESNTKSILDFFKLKNLSEKKKIIIWGDREEYKEHLKNFVKEYKEWMCGDTYDGNINLLDIFEAKKTKKHKDMDIEEFGKGILHEFVHACQQEISSTSEGTVWYWEALATNLSGQKYSVISLENCDFNKLKKHFYGVEHGYSYAFTLGKFMLENYSNEKLLDYIKKPSLLKLEQDNIFKLAKENQI